MRHHLACAALVSAAVLSTSAFYEAKAVTVEIESVVGIWTAASPPAVASGLLTNQISWGVPAAPNTKQSSYTFTGIAPSGPHNVGIDFSLGQFTHANFPIFAPAITDATLSLTIKGTAHGVGDTAFEVNSIFKFLHNETPNGDGGCCNDIVTGSTNVGGSQVVVVDGINYLFAFTGFQVGGVDFTEFSTVENANNIAFLQGSFLQPQNVPGEVPIPAALPLFATGLAVLRPRGATQKEETGCLAVV